MNLCLKRSRLSVLFLLLILLGLTRASGMQIRAIPTAGDREHGVELFTQHRYREAVQSLGQAVRNNKQDYDAWLYLGLALAKQQKLRDASKSIDQAVKLRPNSAEAHNALAYVMVLRNKLADAISEANNALRLNPGMAEPHYFLGIAHLRTDERKEALAEAEIAIKLDPQYAPSYLLKSQALVSFFNEVILADPKATAEKHHDRYVEAAAALEQFLKLSPNPDNKQTWVEQLESLKIYATFHQPTADRDNQPDAPVLQRVKVLSKPGAGYTELARRNQTQGTVVLRAIFAADGMVKHILVIKGLPDGLSEEAVRAAAKIKFVPASVGGKPVSMFMQLEYTFNTY